MYLSMDYWYTAIVHNTQKPSLQLIDNMFSCLEREVPKILSVVAERACNLQCTHCIFQQEHSSNSPSASRIQMNAIRTILTQMEAQPLVVHEGRIFHPSHLQWLKMVRESRGDAQVGIIDNGTYTRFAEEIESSGFHFDWMDVSLDGTETVHNDQRASQNAFRIAIEGIQRARDFLVPGGRVTSLFTLTRKNYNSILDTTKVLPREVDQWHLTTLSPARPKIEHLSVTEEEFAVSWKQMVSVRESRPVTLRIYLAADILKLARAVGYQAFLAAVKCSRVDYASLCFEINGISIVYYPHSVSTSETFVIDADAAYRLPYSVAYTLEEHRRGRSRFGEDIRSYTVVPRIEPASNLASLYQRCVRQWREIFALSALEHELSIFNQMRE